MVTSKLRMGAHVGKIKFIGKEKIVIAPGDFLGINICQARQASASNLCLIDDLTLHLLFIRLSRPLAQLSRTECLFAAPTHAPISHLPPLLYRHLET